jgi:hypothetical protein
MTTSEKLQLKYAEWLRLKLLSDELEEVKEEFQASWEIPTSLGLSLKIDIEGTITYYWTEGKNGYISVSLENWVDQRSVGSSSGGYSTLCTELETSLLPSWQAKIDVVLSKIDTWEATYNDNFFSYYYNDSLF